jgi:O-antigen/teichoic acid export membrane protein
MGTIAAPAASQRGKRFIQNVFWNWLGVGVTVVSAFLVSPYMIRKLGPEAYGIWALSFALVEYFQFFDLGFRGATIKYVAHYWALEQYEKVTEVVNTGVTYAGATAGLVFLVVITGSRFLDRFFQISASYRESFFELVLLVSISWCISVVLSLYGTCLEALQRFDYYNRILLIGSLIRVPGTLLLLFLGGSLVQIGMLVVSSQLLSYLFYYVYFRRIHPTYRFSFATATWSMLRHMYNYGIHNFVGNISQMLLMQAPPVIIGHFQPAAFVGYFQLPMRLLQYSGEAVNRIGAITNANAAELSATGETHPLGEMAVFTNRYCMTVFMPLTLFFLLYGKQFFQLWVPKSAEYCSPILPVLLIGYVIAIIGQFSSSMLLMGMAKYKTYSRGLVVEGAASLLSLWFIVPRYGIMGAAVVTATAMILNRGLFLPWLVSRVVGFKYSWFMHSIYTWPVLSAIPAAAIGLWLKAHVFSGTVWFSLAAGGAALAALYYPVAAALCLPSDHRVILKTWIRNRLP